MSDLLLKESSRSPRLVLRGIFLYSLAHMQAVILAAGRGTRMGDLTQDLPKPLFRIGDRTRLEHTLSSLPDSVDEIILVVNYHADKIRDAIGDSYNEIPVRYVFQTERLGTGHAVFATREYVKGNFLVLMADDHYSKESIQLASEYPWSITVSREPVGRSDVDLTPDENGFLRPSSQSSVQNDDGTILMNTGLYSLTSAIFDHPLAPYKDTNEFSLPHTVLSLAEKYPIKILETKDWLQMNTPEQLEILQKIIGVDR